MKVRFAFLDALRRALAPSSRGGTAAPGAGREVAALVGLLLVFPGVATAAQENQDGGVPAIQDDGNSYILNFAEEGEDLLTLEEFVKLCQEATGRNFTYTKDTAALLEGANVIMFGTKRVPKEDFYNFFQIQMFINDFVCVTVGPPHIEVILIQSLTNARASSNLRSKSVYVDPRDLDDYGDAPATLITTVLNLPNTDTRQLSTSLRSLLTDTNTQNLIPAGDNSVILQGFGSQVVSLAHLLELVDKESRIGDVERPVFTLVPLTYAAAQDVADLIDQLLEAQTEATNQARRTQPQAEAGGVLGGSEVEPKILVDGRTNSLLVMATADEMPLIKDLIAQLDVEVLEPERNFHVYVLQNVNAEDLAEVLDNFLSDAERLTDTGGVGGRAGGAGGAGGAGATTARTSNEVIVVADPSANALLIAANKTRYEEVLDLVQHLDRRQDQVLIETALIELTSTSFRDIGFEWAFADVNGDGGFGLTNFGLSTLQDSDGDGIPDLRVPVAGEGITGGVLSGDDVNIPFLVSAIEREDGANVLNVPSVLVNNNGNARVVTLDEQPTTTITSTGGVGGQTQENFREFEEAGITLEISPSISASRYLRLDISLVVSTFVGSSSNSTIPSPRITREIHTVVNIPDGYTMVIGGIITDNDNETSRGIPWLRQVPLIGALFGRESSQNNRTTLYFFVTPHILRDKDFADLAELSYQKKLEAAKVIGVDRVRVIDPRFAENETEDIYEPFQVPLYQSPERGENIDLGRWDLDPSEVQERLRNGRGEVEVETDSAGTTIEEGEAGSDVDFLDPDGSQEPDGSGDPDGSSVPAGPENAEKDAR